MSKKTILSADIGGTNSRFMLHQVEIPNPDIFSNPSFSIDSLPSTLILNKKYENHNFKTFIDVLQQFLKDSGVSESEPPATACFAVAGPVKNNEVVFTNRNQWSINGDQISKALNIPSVQLVNDFLAVGYGLLTLNEETECIILNNAPKQKNAPIACIGPGTGLGECFLAPRGDGAYVCYPTEGGHAEFAPRNEVEIGLLRFLKAKFQQAHRISVERVVSGPGLANVYEYLHGAFPELVDHDLHAQIEASGEMKGAIISHNLQSELCRKTMDIFVTAYGAEAGVAGLKWLPYGGLYLTGGLTPKNIDLIRDPKGPFMHALMDKGRVSGMLNSVPIYAVLVENLGERGAHYTAMKLLQDHVKTTQPPTPPTPPTTPATPATAPVAADSVKITAAAAAVAASARVHEHNVVAEKKSCCVVNNLAWTAFGAGTALLFVWLRCKKYL